MDKEQFYSAVKEKVGIELTELQKEQYNKYYNLVVEWNQKINLTAITEEEEFYTKHFFDSISLAFYKDYSNIESICDVGSGAGFPSIPLKILYPNLKVTIVDSLNKRLEFDIEGEERHILEIRKAKETPNKYPRKAGTPNKKPIL